MSAFKTAGLKPEPKEVKSVFNQGNKEYTLLSKDAQPDVFIKEVGQYCMICKDTTCIKIYNNLIYCCFCKSKYKLK